MLASAFPFHSSLCSLTKPAVCRLLKNPLEPERLQEIITEAVDIEKSFICDSLPVSSAVQAQVLIWLSAMESTVQDVGS